MQLAELGLIASALQLCVAHHAHAHAHTLAHIPRHKHTRECALSSDVGCTPKAVITRSTTSILFFEADVDIQYQELDTTTSTVWKDVETALGKQYRAGLQPTNVGSHDHLQAVPSQGWTGRNGANLTWGLDNHSSAIHQATSHITATPLIHHSLKPSMSTASAGGTLGNHNSFSSSGSHGKRSASCFAVLVIVLILAGASLST